MMYTLEKFILEFAPAGDCTLENFIRPFISRNVIKRGGFLLRATDICEQLTFINQGICCRFNRGTGRDYVTGCYYDGELAGDYDGFTPYRPVHYYIRAIEDLYVEQLSFSAIAMLTGLDPAFEQIFKTLAEYSYCKSIARAVSFQHTPDAKCLNLVEQRADGIKRRPRSLIGPYLGIHANDSDKAHPRLFHDSIIWS